MGEVRFVGLYDPSKAVRRTDPVTSHEAAALADVVSERGHRWIVRILLEAGCPLAAEEIGDRGPSGIDKVSVGKRLAELERGGVVERTEERYRNRSGRYALKWRLTASFLAQEAGQG